MAMDLQGKATDAINEFVRYRNKAFEPLKPDAEIQAMVDVPEELINRADSAINSIRTAPERYREPILKLRDQIMEVATTVYKHKLFLRQYFKLPAKQRKGCLSRRNKKEGLLVYLLSGLGSKRFLFYFFIKRYST